MTTPSLDYWAERRDQIVAEEDKMDFDSFDHRDAWELGSQVFAHAVERRLPLSIAVDFGEQRVFHAALPGTSATNDDWLARKLRVVRRHNRSSYGVGCEHRADGVDYYAETGYDRALFTISGGAVPLRVHGSLIGAVAVSGLTEEEDHTIVLQALETFKSDRDTDRTAAKSPATSPITENKDPGTGR